MNKQNKVGVVAMDRDETVETGRGPVSLELIDKLKGLYYVYATGNQLLKEEADLPGVDAITDEIEGNPGVEGKKLLQRKLLEKHPNLIEYIIVDDEDVSGVEGFEYMPPDKFVDIFEKSQKSN